jgi:nucleotide-binding universal stress UspA family protein
MSGKILVGVDGSETAKLATRWAAQEARLRGAKLELVAAWEIPANASGYGFATISDTIYDDFVQDLEQSAKDNLAVAVEEVRTEAEQVEVETTAVEGQAARVLLEASKDADLLVVGSRGLGGFGELLLGSVSQQCAHHSTCPVVIVRRVHGDS